MVDELDSREIRREEVIRAQIVEVGRRLYLRSYVASNDGNISVRLGNNHLITTPKGISKGFMTPDMLVVTDLSGRKISGDRDPSSELLMHLTVYEDRPEIRAVVHASEARRFHKLDHVQVAHSSGLHQNDLIF